MSKVLNLQGMSIQEMSQKIEEEVKSFFIKVKFFFYREEFDLYNGDYSFPVVTDSKNELREACKEATGNLYQADWNVEVSIKAENIDGTFEIEVIDLNEEEEEIPQAIHLTLKEEDFCEGLNQTLFQLDIVKNILNWPEEPSKTITFVAPEAELQSFLNKIKGMGEIELEDLQDGQYWDGDKIIMVENGNILY